jgi:hypothetical protein
LPRPTPGRSLRSIIPKNKRKLGFCRASCQLALFSSRAFPPRKVTAVEHKKTRVFYRATRRGSSASARVSAQAYQFSIAFFACPGAPSLSIVQSRNTSGPAHKWCGRLFSGRGCPSNARTFIIAKAQAHCSRPCDLSTTRPESRREGPLLRGKDHGPANQ